MIIAVGALSFMDACLKALSPHYSALQVATLRGLSALPLVLAWVALRGGFRQLLSVRFPLHLARGALGITMLVAFTYGVRHLPLSETYTIFFVAPLVITALGALLLGERVGPARWIAIAVGFAGVLVVLRPTGSNSLSLPGLAVLLTAVCYALSAITVRVLGRTDSNESMVFWLMLIIAVGSGLMAIPGWRPIQSADWPVIGAMAVTGSLGQLAITEAFSRGEVSFIAPFEYTAIVWGTALDWFVWGTTPAALTFTGAAIVIASGVYLLRREQGAGVREQVAGSTV